MVCLGDDGWHWAIGSVGIDDLGDVCAIAVALVDDNTIGDCVA